MGFTRFTRRAGAINLYFSLSFDAKQHIGY
nr:MAG TPA: hypothetical protein [Bacteriophage sp.]